MRPRDSRTFMYSSTPLRYSRLRTLDRFRVSVLHNGRKKLVILYTQASGDPPTVVSLALWARTPFGLPLQLVGGCAPKPPLLGALPPDPRVCGCLLII